MKKKLTAIFTAFALASSIFFANSSCVLANDISIFFNEEELTSDQSPIIIDGTTYVPMRCIFEAYGFEIDWNNDLKRIKAKNPSENYVMILQVDSTKINVCGNEEFLDKAPIIINNRVFLPLRAVGEKLNSQVNWDNSSKKISINSSGSLLAPVSKRFNYQNYENSTFWSDKTWNPNLADDSEDDYYDYLDNFYDNYSNNNNYYELKNDYNSAWSSNNYYDNSHHNKKTNHKPSHHHNNENKQQETKPNTNSNITVKPQVASAFEFEVFKLVNAERKKANLSEFLWNDALATVARSHSEDMIKRNFFDHINPDNQSPFDRYRAFGIKYSKVAENIACGQKNPAEVVNSWMNFSSHRANILDPNLKELGVGLAYGGEYGYYWTQCFLTK